MRSKSDGLSEVIDRLRAELGVIKEELRVIELRKPALESRANRIGEALATLIGDGSTGDPRWLSMPRITEHGLDHGDSYATGGQAPEVRREPKTRVGPVKRPEITEEALVAMSYYTQKSKHPVKSAELYEHLVAEGLLEPIETEMPYKSFAITLRNIHQDLIEYDRNSKTWSLKSPSPKAKLREAMEKAEAGGMRVTSSHNLAVNREDNHFVKAVAGVFKSNRFEGMSATRLYDELSEQRDFGLIPGAGNLSEFTATMESYQDFFPLDSAGNYRCIRQDLAAKAEAGAPGLYTVKHNGGVAA